MNKILLLSLVAFFAMALHGADRTAKASSMGNDKLIAAVRAADDERLAATKAADRARLDAIYSDDLHYAHSSGKIDTKASQIQGLTSGANAYEKFEHMDRKFVPAAPGIVLMTGRVVVHMTNSKTSQKNLLDLNYLAVWREEKGKWRFLAWQSCKNPPAGEAKK
jgi:ketosteroid isomerase-like protein